MTLSREEKGEGELGRSGWENGGGCSSVSRLWWVLQRLLRIKVLVLSLRHGFLGRALWVFGGYSETSSTGKSDNRILGDIVASQTRTFFLMRPVEVLVNRIPVSHQPTIARETSWALGD